MLPGDSGCRRRRCQNIAGRLWFADAGGVKPYFPDEGPRRRPRLSFEEREEIALGVAAQESVRRIANRLKRAPSTIWREIKNNSSNGRNHYRPQYRFGVHWRGGPQRRPQYKATAAQARSQRRARRPEPGKLAGNPWLRELVQTRLDEQHSPEQIAGAAADGPPRRSGDVGVPRNDLSVDLRARTRRIARELHRCLRTGRAVRRPQRQRRPARRTRMPDMVNISERPAEVERPCRARTLGRGSGAPRGAV